MSLKKGEFTTNIEKNILWRRPVETENARIRASSAAVQSGKLSANKKIPGSRPCQKALMNKVYGILKGILSYFIILFEQILNSLKQAIWIDKKWHECKYNNVWNCKTLNFLLSRPRIFFSSFSHLKIQQKKVNQKKRSQICKCLPKGTMSAPVDKLR